MEDLKELCKKQVHKYYDKVVIFLVATYVSLPYLGSNYYSTFDYIFHHSRIRSTIAGLRDGQIIPQIDPNSFDSAGYAYNLFYGPLPTYFVTLFRVFTPTWVLAYNLVTYLGVLLSSIIMYKIIYTICCKYKKDGLKEVSNVVATLGTVVFLISNPILMYLYIGTSIGPLYALTFALLCLLGFINIFYGKSGAVFIAVGAAGTILCHTITTLIVSIAFLVILVINYRQILQNGKWKKILVGVVGAVGLSAYFTIPLIENMSAKYLNVSNQYFEQTFQWASAEIINPSRQSLGDLLFSGGNIAGDKTFAIITILIIILFTINVACRKYNRLYFSLHISLFIMLILQSNYIDWRLMPNFLYTIQGVGRMIYITGTLSAICLAFSVYILANQKRFNKWVILTVLVTFGPFSVAMATMPSPQGAPGAILPATNHTDSDFNYDSHTRELFADHRYVALAIGEYLPTNLTTCNKSLSEIFNAQAGFIQPRDPYNSTVASIQCRQQRGDKVLTDSESATISNTAVVGSHTDFDITTKNYTTVELPKTYYLGYKATGTTDTGTINLDTFESGSGWVAVNIPEGFSGHIKAWYGMTILSILGGCITLITLLLLLLYGIRTQKTSISDNLTK
ncbi:membrane protein [Actinomycetota bacterium]|nr:membrane protein [Actinomycetota bacterium]